MCYFLLANWLASLAACTVVMEFVNIYHVYHLLLYTCTSCRARPLFRFALIKLRHYGKPSA